MNDLTGTVYIHNAIKYDFCIEESIRSIAPICKEVICLECDSDDGTDHLLLSLKDEIPNLRIISTKWDIGIKHDRLRMLSDIARAEVKTPWRIHIQADEVLHESSFVPITMAINQAKDIDEAFTLRRINLFGNFDSYIPTTMPKAPCGTEIIRIARSTIGSMGDDQSLNARMLDTRFSNEIIFFHYSYLRKHRELVEKSIYMQTWFFNNPNAVDNRILDAKKNGFDPYLFIPKEKLSKLDITHPVVAREWVKERRGLYV